MAKRRKRGKGKPEDWRRAQVVALVSEHGNEVAAEFVRGLERRGIDLTLQYRTYDAAQRIAASLLRDPKDYVERWEAAVMWFEAFVFSGQICVRLGKSGSEIRVDLDLSERETAKQHVATMWRALTTICGSKREPRMLEFLRRAEAAEAAEERGERP